MSEVGHLPRVIYHQVYWYTKIRVSGVGVGTLTPTRSLFSAYTGNALKGFIFVY